MIITLNDYLGPWASVATEEQRDNATAMLEKVNAFLEAAELFGVEIGENPVTKTCVSGEQYGGFRPADCPIGAEHSSHKLGRAVDIFDPYDALDNWATDARLEAFQLYREAPTATRRWCHLTDKAPGSGKRTFQP